MGRHGPDFVGRCQVGDRHCAFAVALSQLGSRFVFGHGMSLAALALLQSCSPRVGTTNLVHAWRCEWIDVRIR